MTRGRSLRKIFAPFLLGSCLSVSLAFASPEPGRYDVRLRKGDFLDVRVDQDGADVAVVLVGPDGTTLREVDTPTGEKGPEFLWWIASDDGDYRIEIRGAADAGGYDVHLAPPRPAAEIDVLRANAQGRYLRGQQHDWAGQAELATVEFAAVRRLWQRLRDPFQEALSLSELGRMAARVNQLDDAVAYYREAQQIVIELGEERQQVRLLNLLGLAQETRGELAQAAASYREALQLAQRIGHLRGAGSAARNLGNFHYRRGEAETALTFHELARDVWTRLDQPSRKGNTLRDMANCYMLLGRPDEALEALGEVLRLVEGGSSVTVAGTLNSIGWLHYLRDEPERALRFYHRALEIQSGAEPDSTTAATHDRMGTAYVALERWGEAAAAYDRALAIVEAAGYRASQGHVLANLCRLRMLAGETSTALETCAKALAILEEVDDGPAIAWVLYLSARLERHRGELHMARTYLQQCIDLVERLRSAAGREALKTSFFADRLEFYELYVDVLMDLHDEDRDAGWNVRALEVAERGRARSLLDLLAEAGADVRRGADPELLEEERWLGARIEEQELRREELEETGATPRERAAAQQELQRLLREHDLVHRRIVSSNPAFTEHADPQPIDVPSLQALLDSDTVLLAFALGGERSFAWRVTRTRVESDVLSARADIESAARAWYELLSDPEIQQSGKGQQQVIAKALSNELLDLVTDLPADRRLVVLADGALHYIPFGALPLGGDGEDEPEPLVARHEVLSLPSASALSALRRQLAGRSPPPGLVAVVTDPVFDARDERLARRRVTDSSKPPPEGRRFDRLAGAAREAAAILELASGQPSLEIKAFEAHRERIFSGELAGYRILHFATHGVLDAGRPQLSGLALSGVDEQGNARPGFLRFHEIFNLDLPAELAFLSACKTALGPEIRGEGLIGLTRAFYYAGVPRLVVSLWNVEDGSAAELVERFYRGLLAEGLAPAAALRAAQVSMWKEGRWSPYQWAGFVLQGEWRGFATSTEPR